MKKLNKKNERALEGDSHLDKEQLHNLQVKIDKRTKELEYSLSLVRATLESTTDGILMVSIDGEIEDFNHRFIELLKVPQWVLDSKDQTVALKYMFSVIEEPKKLQAVMMDVIKHPEKQGDIGELRFKDGRIFERYSLPQRIGDKIVGRVWSFRDVTERRKTEEALRLRERAIEASTHGVVICEAKFPYEIIYINPAFEKITGFSKKDAYGKDILFFKDQDADTAQIKRITLALSEHREVEADFISRSKSGHVFWNEMHIAPVYNAQDKVNHFVAIVVDITERKKMEEALLHQATHDALTDLPNRSLLYDRLKQNIIYAKRQHSILAILFLDLDHFKFTNDSMGHGAGDRQLKIVSDRLMSCVRETDTVARIGGDEFVIISTGHKQIEDVIPLAQKILRVISKPYTINDIQVNTTTSIGISIYPSDGSSVENLMKNADIAMYQAKEMGRNNFQFYTKEMNQHIIERLELETGLREAIKEQQFELYYQPLVNLSTQKMIGAEALIRWKKNNKIIMPTKFISLAEEIGLIIPIGEWVLDTACRQAKEWQDRGLNLVIAVNISAKQLKQPDLVNSVKKIIKKHNIDPSLIELELTESAVMDNTEHNLRILLALKELGLKLVIDDFGTGYSSLSYLSRFPVNKLKIDRTFIKSISDSKNPVVLVQTIIAMAKNLKLKVLAEGIETEEQLKFLQKYNCDEGQGFYLHKPMNILALNKLIF